MKDVNGVDRGPCKVCGVKECPEFISEEGTAKCGYFLHVPVSHERKVRDFVLFLSKNSKVNSSQIVHAISI